jgi:hypothetical protein
MAVPMADVRFAFGNRPGIPGHEAADLADLPYLRHTADAYELAHRIRYQAESDPARGQAGEDIQLNNREMRILLALLDQEPQASASAAISRLVEELRLAVDQR